MKLPQELAKDSSNKFLDTFKNLYEHSPWFVEQSLEIVLEDEKYNNLEKFHALLSEIMLSANTERQDNLITSHPMLAGKKAQNNQLTEFSTTEQKSAGLNDCTDDEIKLLAYNDTHLGGKGFLEWEAFEHPQLGKVELGGWNFQLAWRNPPPKFLEKEIEPFADWFIWQALITPKFTFVYNCFITKNSYLGFVL